MTEIIPNQNPNKKRNKIILIVVLSLIIFCLIACGVIYFAIRHAVTDMVKADPEQARIYAAQIADYDLPPGYKEQIGSSTAGNLTVAITDESGQNMVYLIQSPTGSLPEQEIFLHNGIRYETNNPITWTVKDIQIYTIRGEKSSITLYDGATDDGKQYHAQVGKFKGKGGPALLVIVGPDETWDETLAKAFIQSLH